MWFAIREPPFVGCFMVVEAASCCTLIAISPSEPSKRMVPHGHPHRLGCVLSPMESVLSVHSGHAQRVDNALSSLMSNLSHGSPYSACEVRPVQQAGYATISQWEASGVEPVNDLRPPPADR